MARAPTPMPRSARPGGYSAPGDIWGKINSGLGRNANALIGLGSGLLSQPTFAKGLAAGGKGFVAGEAADNAQLEFQEERDRLAQAEEEKNQTITALKETRPDLYEKYRAGAPLLALWGEALKTPKATDAPSNVQEWEYFSKLTPEQQAQYLTMKRSNPYLDVGTGFMQPNPVAPGTPNGPVIPKNGDVPTGFNQTGPGQIAPMPGSEPDRERAAGQIKAQSAINSLEQKNAIVIDAIDKATQQSSGWNTGNVMGNSGWVPGLGQGAVDLGEVLKTIQSNIGFEELQTMRDNSPTGGALGAITERELAFLQSTIASIQQSQSEQQLDANLKTLRDFLAGMKDRRRSAYEQQYGGGQGAAPPSAAGGGNVTSGGVPWSIEP